MIGATQQVAGAAGTALFVAIMTLRAAGLSAGGASVLQATTGGIKAAFFCGAIISLGAIATALFIRKPEGGAGVGGHH